VAGRLRGRTLHPVEQTVGHCRRVACGLGTGDRIIALVDQAPQALCLLTCRADIPSGRCADCHAALAAGSRPVIQNEGDVSCSCDPDAKSGNRIIAARIAGIVHDAVATLRTGSLPRSESFNRRGCHTFSGFDFGAIWILRVRTVSAAIAVAGVEVCRRKSVDVNRKRPFSGHILTVIWNLVSA